MTIYGVTATASELAGAGLQAFLGFFDQRFRDHDYDIGRKHAQAVLTNPGLAATSLSEPGALGPLRYDPSPINPIDSRMDGLKMRDVPVADLRALKRAIRRRINHMLRESLGPTLAFPAMPEADLILEALLNYLIARF